VSRHRRRAERKNGTEHSCPTERGNQGERFSPASPRLSLNVYQTSPNLAFPERTAERPCGIGCLADFCYIDAQPIIEDCGSEGALTTPAKLRSKGFSGRTQGRRFSMRPWPLSTVVADCVQLTQ
jgi:hypothetical protein